MSTMQRLGSERLVDLNSTVGHQRLVDVHFRHSATYWRNLYNANGLFEVIHQQRRAIVLGFVDELALSPGSHILEIGCGAGLTTIALAQRGFNVQAVDTVDRMVALTRQGATEAGVADRVMTSLGDAHTLAFPEGAFSLVIGMGVAPFLHSLNTAITECARVLRPGGYSIFTTDNRWRLNHMLDPVFFPPLRKPRRWVRTRLERFKVLKVLTGPRANSHSIREFDAWLAAAGLEKIRGTTVGFGPFTLFDIELLPDSLGVRLHHKLQRLADSNYPLLQRFGSLYIPLVRKRSAHNSGVSLGFRQSGARGSAL
jgi:2-polyprenyl-3-methyl-5-hydroxy-6-metoxy-1,4-benzoquinol methylase